MKEYTVPFVQKWHVSLLGVGSLKEGVVRVQYGALLCFLWLLKLIFPSWLGKESRSEVAREVV